MSSGSYGPPGLEKSNPPSSTASTLGSGMGAMGYGSNYQSYAYGYNPYNYTAYA